jgi:hypothetical protein
MSDSTSTSNQLLPALLNRGTSLPSQTTGLDPSREVVRGGLRAPALPERVGYPLSGDTSTRQFRQPSARFVGPVTGAALFNTSTPTNHPQRNRRLDEERLFWGWEVAAEGTDGAFLTDEVTFDTGGIDVSSLDPALHRLVLLGRSDGGVIALGVWPVQGFLGTEITLNIDGPDAPDLSLTYTWQVVKASPCPLLPVPNQGGPGAEVLYLTRKPDVWPAFVQSSGQEVLQESNFLSGAVTVDPVTGRYNVAAGAPYAGAVGDFLFIKSVKSIFRVHSFGSPGPNDVVLEPFWNVTLNQYVAGATSFGRLKTVGQVSAHGASFVLGSGGLRVLFNTPDLLDDVRVFPLINPMDGPPEVRPYGQDLVLNPPSATFRTQFNLGYRLTLFPADGSGNPDLTRPLTLLEGLVIDPAVPLAEQSVTVDYATGAILLSHPIPATGGDLNPSGYVDANGQRRLFATFASYNRVAAPLAAAAVVAPGAGYSGSGLFFTEEAPFGADLADRGPHWVLKLPETQDEQADAYHPRPQPEAGEAAGPSKPAFVFSSKRGLGPLGYPKLQTQWRSPNSGLTAGGGVLFGRLNEGDSPNQVVFLPAATREEFNRLTSTETDYDSDGQPWTVFQDGWKETILDVSGSAPITLGVNDTLALVVNDLPMEVVLPTGVVPPTALQVAGALDAAIFAASAAYGIPQADGVQFTTEVWGPSNQQVRIRARDLLYWGTANGHANVAAPSLTRVQSLEFIQAFGSGTAGRSQWELRGLNLDGDAHAAWTGRDVSIDGGPSVRGAGRLVEAAYAPCVLEGCAANAGAPGMVNIDGGRLFLDAGRNGEVEGREVILDPVVLDFNGQSGNLFYVFYDRDSQQVRYQGLPLLDVTFRGGPPTGVPLARVLWNGLSFEYVMDARVFPTQRLQNGILTVGTNGMFTKLHAAMWWMAEHPEVVREVQLVSDIVVDYTQREQVYLPEGVRLEGNNYTIQANNFGGSGSTTRSVFVFADPFSDQATRNITIRNFRLDVTGTGAQQANLFADVGSSPPTGVGPVTVEDVYVTHAGALTTLNAGLLTVYPGHFAMSRVSALLGLRFNNWVQSTGAGSASYPFGLEFRIRQVTVLGADPRSATSAMFATEGNTEWHLSQVSCSASGGATNPLTFLRGNLNTSRNRIYVSRCEAYTGTGDIFRLNSATVTSDLTVLQAEGCTFSTEDDAQGLLTGPVLRDLDISMQKVLFTRATPVAGVAGAGFNWGTVAGSTPSRFVFEDCSFNNMLWSGTPGSNSRAVLDDVRLTGVTGLGVGVSSGLGSSLELRKVSMDDGYVQISAWARALISSCTLTQVSALPNALVQFQNGELSVRDSTLNKVSTSTQSTLLLSGSSTIRFFSEGLKMVHGQGLTGSTRGLDIDNTTVGDATLQLMQLHNVSSYYVGGDATTAAAFFFGTRTGPTRAKANFQLSNFHFEGYTFQGGVQLAFFVGTFWSRFNVVSGFNVNSSGGAPTVFNVNGGTTDYYLGTAVHFIDP